MKIGIFGGSFNPPHKMHYLIADSLLNSGYVDKIIYVPTGSKYKYKDNLVNDFDRLEMLKIMILNDDRCSVSDYELKDHVIYTYQTLAYFKDKYPDDEIYFICGTDNLTYLDKWMRGLYILENYKILVIRRDTDKTDEVIRRFDLYKDNIIVTDVSLNSLSSTFIRDKILLGEDVSEYLDSNVLKYIEENNLYRGEN